MFKEHTHRERDRHTHNYIFFFKGKTVSSFSYILCLSKLVSTQSQWAASKCCRTRGMLGTSLFALITPRYGCLQPDLESCTPEAAF